MSERCPICGETPPTGELCIPKLVGIATPGEPCDYSLEGEARFAADIGEEKAALLMAVLTPTPTDTDA